MVCIAYMVAGISSRFGGRIKQFAVVGPSGETLMECSMKQAKAAGFDRIIFIVGEKTEKPFKDKFGNSFEGLPVVYARQTFDPAERDRPWGTADAVVAAKGVVDDDFAVCNGDDLYGTDTFRLAREALESGGHCVAIGYRLDSVLPATGKTNRGIFRTDSQGFVTSIEEVFEIERDKLEQKGLKGSDLCSMNLFGLKRAVMPPLEQALLSFKAEHKGDRRAECLLPEELGKLVKAGAIKIKVQQARDEWMGITNPEDEAAVRKKLSGSP